MANLVELFDNIVQMQHLNGVPLANGKLYVYALGRTRLMDTWSDVDGESLNTNPIILDDAGQAHCFVSDDFDYTLVVCDEYNNEVFSIDKYLYSKGEHSHADVAVAPSEHIGVSSYHVGETTVYVPYIQGELGKTYHGIEPIVVNNQENKISARNIPLGVQEPLYFVEDSESACIIGASGLQPSGNYATVDWVLEHDYMQKEKLEFNESGQVTGFDGSAFAAGYVDPSEFIPWSASGEFQSAGNYATTDDLTAYYPASNPNGFIDSDAISAMATTGLVADVSADITATIPSTAGLATENWVTSQGYITSLDGLMSASLLESSGGLITGYNGTAFAGQGGGVTGEYELSAGNGISIDNYPIEQKTVISVTGDYLTKDSADTLYQPTGDYLSSNALEGYATEDWVNSQGYITTETDWTDTITAASANAYNEATAAIPAPFDPTYLSGQIDNKLDTTAFSTVSGDFLTAHQSLADYQTTAGMTAYQPAGDYYSASNPSGFVTSGELPDPITIGVQEGDTLDTDYDGLKIVKATANGNEHINLHKKSTDQWLIHGNLVPTSPGSNKYLVTDDSGAMHWDNKSALAYDSAFEQSGGMITAYNGSAFKAGDELPSGVMVESAVEYNAVNEISAYNGSAIAQYGAEKQFIVHDDTLCHLSNSAQFALGVNLSAVAQLLGVDETVLWSGSINLSTNPTITANESVKNFEKVEFIGKGYPTDYDTIFGTCFFNSQSDGGIVWIFGHAGGSNGAAIRFNQCRISATNNILAIDQTKQFNITGTGTTTANTPAVLTKIIGIGRRS